MIPDYMGVFTQAVAQSSPKGIALVEDAIDAAIKTLDYQSERLNPAGFGEFAFISKSDFGTADRSSALATAHTKAHSVMLETLKGVRGDLVRFRDACDLTRKDIKEIDGDAAAALAKQAQRVGELDDEVTDRGGDRYDGAVDGTGDTTATDDNPYTTPSGTPVDPDAVIPTPHRNIPKGA